MAKKTRKTSTTNGASVVPAEYREQYAEHGGNCGDDLAARLKSHLATKDGGIDRDKLEALAKRNDAWKPNYAALDNGRLRMTVGNVLRAAVKRGDKIDWGRRASKKTAEPNDVSKE
jgi:hypothetical protein